MTVNRTYLRRTPPPPTLVPADSWRDQAACASHPTLPVWMWDDSIHNENDRQRAGRVKQAQAVCADCPVAGPCAEDVDPRWDEGVRAGTDLRRVRRAKRSAS